MSSLEVQAVLDAVASADAGETLPFPDVSGARLAIGSWPGAFIEFAPDGTVIGANEMGGHLASSALGVPGSPLAGLVALSGQAHGSVCDRIEAKIEGTTRWFECVALPAGGGRIFVLARDETYDVNIRQALFDSRQRYRDLVTISSDFAWETDASGKFVFVSPHGALGYSPEDLLGRRPSEFMVDVEIEESEQVFRARNPVAQKQVWLRNIDDQDTCLLASAVPVIDHMGVWRGARGLCRDVTHERLRDSELAQAKVREQVVAYIVNQIREEARPRAMLESAASMLGRATSSATAVLSFGPDSGWEVLATYGEWPDGFHVEAFVELRARERDTFAADLGDNRLIGRNTWYHGAVNGAVLLLREPGRGEWNDDDRAMLNAIAAQLAIAMRQIADHQELERLSTTDGLTGLLNRRAFRSSLAKELKRAERASATGALLYLDLDNFKSINDSHGHDVGDQVLRKISRMLAEGSREYDIVTRLGGDEFAIWLGDLGRESARHRAEEIVGLIGELAGFSADPEKPLGASIGIAIFEPESTESARDLLVRADSAMYAAKNAGKNRVSVAEPAAMIHGPHVEGALEESASDGGQNDDQRAD